MCAYLFLDREIQVKSKEKSLLQLLLISLGMVLLLRRGIRVGRGRAEGMDPGLKGRGDGSWPQGQKD